MEQLAGVSRGDDNLGNTLHFLLAGRTTRGAGVLARRDEWSRCWRGFRGGICRNGRHVRGVAYQSQENEEWIRASGER